MLQRLLRPVVRQVVGRAFEAEPWMIERLELTQDAIEVAGWALPPPRGPRSACFTLNGRPFEEVEYGIPRAEMGDRFWQRAGSHRAGFRCRTEATPDELFADGYVTFRFDYPGRRRRYWFHDAHFFKDPRRQGPLPDAHRRYRVFGSEDADLFCLHGFTDFRKLDLLLHELFGKGFDGFPRVLDWGCGCGRVTRYLAAIPGIRLAGADVDADNASWCARHLGGDFRSVPLRPPMSLDTGGFDLIVGISVFTHLREPDQFAWLEELHRVAAPGAVLLLSIHGATALNYAGLPWRPYRQLARRVRRNGFVITGVNDQIQEMIAESDYYVNVMHSGRYVRENWGRLFEVLDIVPSLIHTHDLVVLRKP
jgi:SAM-dependent methyltransferase